MNGVTGVTVMLFNVGSTKNPWQLDNTMMADRSGISRRPDFETGAVRKRSSLVVEDASQASWIMHHERLNSMLERVSYTNIGVFDARWFLCLPSGLAMVAVLSYRLPSEKGKIRTAKRLDFRDNYRSLRGRNPRVTHTLVINSDLRVFRRCPIE